MVTIFGTGIDLDDILEEFDGQGHRSKVKVTRSKMSFLGFSYLSEQIPNTGLKSDAMTSYDVMA